MYIPHNFLNFYIIKIFEIIKSLSNIISNINISTLLKIKKMINKVNVNK